MIKLTYTATALSLVVILGACAGNGLEQAKSVSPKGSEFETKLYDGYLDLASSEFAEGDYRDSDNFAQRAITSGTSGGVTPELLTARNLPGDKTGELTSARERLMAALAAGAADKKPAEAAHAQVMFDCWMQEQEENFQPDDIAACRAQYMTAVAKLEESPPKPVAAAAPAPAPEPTPAPLPGPYVVYFDLDQSKLTPDAMLVLSDVAKAAAAGGFSKIVATGHTDLAGQSGYNEALSRKRAEMVSAYLRDSGIAGSKISMSALGQNQPAVTTADGQVEQKNRRVEIKFVR